MDLRRLGSLTWEAWNRTLGGLRSIYVRLGSAAWACTLGGLEVHLASLEVCPVRLGSVGLGEYVSQEYAWRLGSTVVCALG